MATHPPVSPNPLSLHLDTLQAVHLGPSGSVTSSPFLSPSKTSLPNPPKLFIAPGPPSNAVLRENNAPFTIHHTSLSSNHHHWSSLWAVHLGPSGAAVSVPCSPYPSPLHSVMFWAVHLGPSGAQLTNSLPFKLKPTSLNHEHWLTQ